MRSWAARETEPEPEGGSRGAWPLPALVFPKHLCAAGPAAEDNTSSFCSAIHGWQVAFRGAVWGPRGLAARGSGGCAVVS